MTRPKPGTAPMRTSPTPRLLRAIATVAVVASAAPLVLAHQAQAGIVPTIDLRTASNYAVLGHSTVTNTGNSTLDGSLGLSPGTSITGFPPGLVLAPGTVDVTNAAAAGAQGDLTAAYVDAAARPVDGTTTAELANLSLQAGVYSGPGKSPLSLSGPLVLDGAGNPDSVFIFQTDSSLVTASSSTVTLINGAQECNVFWQIGSSATLGSSSVFVGNLLALDSITVNNSVTVHGRALASTGAVTLDNDTFTKPTCATTTASTTTTAVTSTTITDTVATATTLDAGATSPTTAGPAATVPGATPAPTPGDNGADVSGTSPGSVSPTNAFGNLTDLTLPVTGLPAESRGITILAIVSLLQGLVVVRLARRRTSCIQ